MGLCLRVLLPRPLLSWLHLQRDDAAEHDAHAHEHLRRGVCNVKASAGCQGFAVLSRGPTASKMMRQCKMRTPFSTCGGFGMAGLCCTTRRLLLILESCSACGCRRPLHMHFSASYRRLHLRFFEFPEVDVEAAAFAGSSLTTSCSHLEALQVKDVGLGFRARPSAHAPAARRPSKTPKTL